MIFSRPYAKNVCLLAALALSIYPALASAQSFNPSSSTVPAASSANTQGRSAASPSAPDLAGPVSEGESGSLAGTSSVTVSSADAVAPPLPSAPEPAAYGAREKFDVTPDATEYQTPFSRIGIGADVNTMGIGIKAAILLNHAYDARFNVNFLSIDTGRFELEGFNADVNIHMASAGASLDWYPFSSVWRISPGVLFHNANQLSVTSEIVPGTSFTLNGQTFYSATANAATGATPLTGTGILGLHSTSPAFTIAGGFGKFIPRSDRHWSFPSEFGVAFTGAPSANISVSGWTCLNAKQTECSNVNAPGNPVATDFNNALQTSLAKWRRDLARVQIYPLFSYSVVYSFNIR